MLLNAKTHAVIWKKRNNGKVYINSLIFLFFCKNIYEVDFSSLYMYIIHVRRNHNTTEYKCPLFREIKTMRERDFVVKLQKEKNRARRAVTAVTFTNIDET